MHEESVVSGTAAENKMHRPILVGPYALYIGHVTVLNTRIYAYFAQSTYIWNNYAKTKHFKT